MGNYLITGASSGIGEACARKLSAKGHVVIMTARNEEKLRVLSEELPGENHYFIYDLHDMENIKSIFSYCKTLGKKLDGLIYAAGVNADVPFKAISYGLYSSVMSVNCGSFAMMGKFFASKLYSNDNARIVAVSSSASVSCDKGMGLYSASKAAMNSLVKTMAREFIGRGILVNAVLPAGVLTPMAIKKIQTMTGELLDMDAMLQHLSAMEYSIELDGEQPCGIILPHKLAEIIYYLVSVENRYISGALIPVSAGRMF